MTKDYRDITRSISAGLATLRNDTPDVSKAFGALAEAALRDGALDRKTKELIALAISVASRCDGCIGFHAKALARLGATTAEVEEALGMAVYMGGGPAMMYAADALAAWAQFGAPPRAGHPPADGARRSEIDAVSAKASPA